MSASAQSWLDAIPSITGLMAAYVNSPQQPPLIRSWSYDCSHEGIKALHRQVQDVLDVLEAGRMPTQKLRWIFDRTVVYYERRSDGAGMCLVTSHDPWIGDGEGITLLINEFRAASAGEG